MRGEDDNGRGGSTFMADTGAGGAGGCPARARDARGGRVLPAGSLHAGGARRDGAPLGRRQAGRPRAAIPGGRSAHARLDDDGDAGRALAAPRRGWLPAGARPAEGVDVNRLTIAVPVKGRLREPSVSLLE